MAQNHVSDSYDVVLNKTVLVIINENDEVDICANPTHRECQMTAEMGVHGVFGHRGRCWSMGGVNHSE